MRISELSRATGISVASIKYYTREGLVPAGERVGYNQTRYDDQHVARLKLIGALITGGGLSVASAKEVLAAVDDDQLELGDVFAVAQRAGSLAPEVAPAPETMDRVRAFARARGWHVGESNPGMAMVASAIEAFEAVIPASGGEPLTAYADAADRIAQADLTSVPMDEAREKSAETVVVGTILGDTIIAGLRRIAHEHHSKALLDSPATRAKAGCDPETSPEPADCRRIHGHRR